MSFDHYLSLETDPVPLRRKTKSRHATTESRMNDSIGTGSFEFDATAGAIIEKRLDTNCTNPKAVAAKRVGKMVGLAT